MRGAILFLALLVAVIIVIEAMKSNGATDQPLLVDSAFPQADQSNVIPWALNTRCEVNSRNIPLRPERDA